MKLQTLAAVCAALSALSLSTAAYASDAVTAKLAQPVPAKTKFIAGGAMFVCEADACVAAAATSQTYSNATCKAVAEKVGPVTSFANTRAFEADRLAACNANAVAKAGDATRLAKQ